MRADMTPEQVRAAGIYLNGGHRRGWKQRLSALLETPEATIAAWSTRSAGNARPIPGVAAVAIKLLVAMMRQELMVTAHPSQAGDALSERVTALLRHPQPSLREARSITIENSGWLAGDIQPAPWLCIEPAESCPATAPDLDQPGRRIPFGFKDPGSRSGGRPGSSA
jgi:hypothetical protein